MSERIKTMKNYFDKLSSKKDNKIEDLINDTTTKVLQRAKKILCITNHKVSEPLMISSPNFKDMKNLKFKSTKLENGYRIDYNFAVLTSIFFDEKTLFYHKAEVDYITGEADVDLAGQVKLKDIVHMEVKSSYDNTRGEVKVSNLTLKLDLVGGFSINFVLRDHFLFADNPLEGVLTSKERQIIQTIQAAIRI